MIPQGSTWIATDGERAERLGCQLRRELMPEHDLLGVLPGLVVAAQNGASDDSLVCIADEPERFAIVHLTWGGPEPCHPHCRWLDEPGLTAILEGT